MKNIKTFLALLFVTPLFFSCQISESEKEEYLEKVQTVYSKYGDFSKDRVIDAYFKRFRINAPAGFTAELNEEKSMCYSSVSQNGIHIYVWASEANSAAAPEGKIAESNFVFKKDYILSLDRKIAHLGTLREEKKKAGAYNRIYDVSDDDIAITKTYYCNNYAYILIGFSNKNDYEQLKSVTDSFSPTRRLPKWWLVLPFLIILIITSFVHEAGNDSRLNYILMFICIIAIFGISLYPALVEYSRGYILFKQVIAETLNLFIST